MTNILQKAKLAPGSLNGAKILVAYTIHATVDEMGRRGELIEVLMDRERAILSNRKAGWYGGAGMMSEVNVLVLKDGRKFVLDQMEEFAEFDVNIVEDRETRRKAARAKLSDEEASLLGVK